MFQTIVSFFQDGGAFMYPIGIVLIFGVAIAIERYVYLSASKVANRSFWKKTLPHLQRGEFKKAMELARGSKTTTGNMLSAAMSRAAMTSQVEQVELAMEESMLDSLPKLEKRTHYLATFANIATLLGLLGTIIGLIGAFTAVAEANPAEKADLLSANISVAMNTTAFGLMVGIPLFLTHAFLQSKTNEVIGGLERAALRIVNAIGSHKLNREKNT